MKNLTRIAFVVLGMMIANCAYAQASNHEGGEQITKSKFHSDAQRSMAIEHLNSKAKKRRDKDFITSPQCPGDTMYLKCTDKWGLDFVLAGLYQAGEGLNGFGFQAGAAYTTVGEDGLGFMGKVLLGATRTAFNENSVYAGESFLAMTATTGIGLTALRLDKHDLHRIWLEAGVEWNWAPSESQPIQLEDGGRMRLHTKTFTGHPYAAVTYQLRLNNTGNSVSVSAGWKQDRSIDQNDGQYVKGLVFVTVVYHIGSWRHKTRNTGSQLW